MQKGEIEKEKVGREGVGGGVGGEEAVGRAQEAESAAEMEAEAEEEVEGVGALALPVAAPAVLLACGDRVARDGVGAEGAEGVEESLCVELAVAVLTLLTLGVGQEVAKAVGRAERGRRGAGTGSGRG
jgi:hypothetical protein